MKLFRSELKTKFRFIKAVAVFLAPFYFLTNCVFATALDTNFWKQRRCVVSASQQGSDSDQKKTSSETMLASLPMPVIPRQDAWRGIQSFNLPYKIVTKLDPRLRGDDVKKSYAGSPQLSSLLSSLPATYGTVRSIVSSDKRKPPLFQESSGWIIPR